MFKKKSFREFAEFQQSLIKTKGKVCSCMRALSEFESEYKQIADKYFDLKFRQKR